MSRSLKLTQGGLIVSCQVDDDDRDPAAVRNYVASLAYDALSGGARGLRINSVEHVSCTRALTDVPIIGLLKRRSHDKLTITPDIASAKALWEAGADIVAIGCADEIWAGEEGWEAIVWRATHELNIPVLADVSSIQEAKRAITAGAVAVASTLRGYTPSTRHINSFDFEFFRNLANTINVPVIAEGHVDTPMDAERAIRCGAYAVVVGTNITRPAVLTRRFVAAVERQNDARLAIGLDIGGTTIKGVITDISGHVKIKRRLPTPSSAARIVDVAGQLAMALVQESGCNASIVGVAAAGIIDPSTGRIRSATDNIPGWSGTPIGEHLEALLQLPTVVLNDAHAAAVAEGLAGSVRELSSFALITLGTGVGGGLFSDGKLLTGEGGRAGSLGHVTLKSDGYPCNCGRRGCLEVYASSAALERYYTQLDITSEQKQFCANEIRQRMIAGEAKALQAYNLLWDALAEGIADLVNLVDPAAIVLGGGLLDDVQGTINALGVRLAGRCRPLGGGAIDLRLADHGSYSGALGAALYSLC